MVKWCLATHDASFLHYFCNKISNEIKIRHHGNCTMIETTSQVVKQAVKKFVFTDLKNKKCFRT